MPTCRFWNVPYHGVPHTEILWLSLHYLVSRSESYGATDKIEP